MRSAAAAIRSARLVLAQSRRSTHQGRVIGAPVVGAGKVADQDTSLKESISKEHALSKKLTLTDSSLHKSVPYSDGLLLSVGEERKLGFNLHLKYVSVSLRSLQWNASQIQNTFARGYASSNKKTSSPSRKQEWKTSSKSRKQEQKTSSQSKKQELKMSDEDEDEDDNEAEGSLEDDADYDKISDDDDHDVLDEQRISDIDDASDNEEEKEEKGSEGMQYQVPKKKFEIHSPKPKVVNEGPILNEKITARTLRLVDEDNRGHRIVLRDEALFLAKKKQMDLVLVDAKRDPPVCKIFSYMREKYKKEQAVKEKKKTKGAAAKLNEIKELRYNAKTEPKDLKMKVQKAKQFLERGYKVKFVGNFKGFVEEEVDRREEGKMIDSVISMLDDISAIEQGPRYESRQVWVMLKHTKFMKAKKKPKPAVRTTKTEENEKNEALVGNQ